MKINKETAQVNISFKTEKIYPELENITIVPTLEKQQFKSEKYGFENVIVEGIPATELQVEPTLDEQVKEGLFNKVTVNAIETEDLVIIPKEEEQRFNGLFKNITVKSSEGSTDISEEIVVSPTEPIGESRKAIWLQKGKNLYPVHFEIGAFYTENNGGCGFDYSNYPIKKGKTYTFSTTLLKSETGYNTRLYISDVKFPTNDVNYMGFYHADFAGRHTFTAEKDGSFGLQIWKDDLEWVFENDVTPGKVNQFNTNYNFMLEEGATATEYEAYIEPKLYILNNNNEYVEVK